MKQLNQLRVSTNMQKYKGETKNSSGNSMTMKSGGLVGMTSVNSPRNAAHRRNHQVGKSFAGDNIKNLLHDNTFCGAKYISKYQNLIKREMNIDNFPSLKSQGTRNSKVT